MDAPLVSILIPCHNAAPWLAETLRSALAQTWTRIEIILIDDGSTDASVAIANQHACPQLRVIQQANAGQSAAFNRAIHEARGDYFEYLDADDLLHPEKISRQLTALHDAGPRHVASGSWARFTDNHSAALFTDEPVWRDLAPIDWLVSSWSGGGMMHGAAWLVPRTVAKRAGPWSEDLSLVNDFDYFARVLLASDGVKFVKDARTYYRSGNTRSLSAQKTPRAWRSAFDSFSRGTAALLTAEDSPRTRKAAAITFQSFAYSAYPTVPDLVIRAEQRVAALGGCDRPLRSGHLFNTIAAVAGWKTARRVQTTFHRLRASRS